MGDKPLNSQEVVDEARRMAVSEEQASEWFKLSRQAKQTGKCQVCGWKDGDGQVTCFYSPTLGAVTHENSEDAAKRTMTPEQASLFDLRQKLVYISEEVREQYIKLHWNNLVRGKAEHDASGRNYPYISYPGGKEKSIEAAHQEYAESLRREPTSEDYPYRAWIQKEWWVPASGAHANVPVELVARRKKDDFGEWYAWMVHCYEPHPNCGGRQEFVAPYHIRCSKCGVEVRMWEHGIDYDVG